MSKEATETKEETQEPSNVEEAVEMFRKEQAETPPEETEEEESSPESPEEEEEEEEKPPETPESLSFPFTMKIDGKDVEVANEDVLRTYAQQGYHYSQQMEELNKAKGIVDLVAKAHKEGRLVIKDKPEAPPSSEEEKEETEEEEEGFVDPEVKQLRETLKAQKKEVESLKAFVFKKEFEGMHKHLLTRFEELKKEHPLARKKDFFDKLAELDEDGNPIYLGEDGVEKAAKDSHKETEDYFKQYIKENPEFLKLSEEEKKKTIAKYLEEQEELTKAPVGSPSEKPSATPAKKEKEIKSIEDAWDGFKEWHKGREEAGRKS